MMSSRNDKAAALSLENVTFSFGKNAAVRDFSLEVETGSFTTLLGPSGCGKTTLLRLISGFLSPQHGTIRIDGADQRGIAPNLRKVGMVFQDYALFPHLTVAQNLLYGIKLKKDIAKADWSGLIHQTARILALSALLERYPHELSGGQQQRVALGRALVLKPRILLMDEPLSSLDAKLRTQVREELQDIQRELGITTVYVTHDQEEALSLSDRIAVLHHGTLQQAGTAEDVYFRPKNRFVADFVGRANFIEGEADAGADGAYAEKDGTRANGAADDDNAVKADCAATVDGVARANDAGVGDEGAEANVATAGESVSSTACVVAGNDVVRANDTADRNDGADTRNDVVEANGAARANDVGGADDAEKANVAYAGKDGTRANVAADDDNAVKADCAVAVDGDVRANDAGAGDEGAEVNSAATAESVAVADCAVAGGSATRVNCISGDDGAEANVAATGDGVTAADFGVAGVGVARANVATAADSVAAAVCVVAGNDVVRANDTAAGDEGAEANTAVTADDVTKATAARVNDVGGVDDAEKANVATAAESVAAAACVVAGNNVAKASPAFATHRPVRMVRPEWLSVRALETGAKSGNNAPATAVAANAISADAATAAYRATSAANAVNTAFEAPAVAGAARTADARRASAFTGTVLSASFLGAVVRYRVRCAAFAGGVAVVDAATTAGRPLAAGTPVVLTVHRAYTIAYTASA